MDTQLLISWIIVVLVALGLDIGIYIFLRLDWKKNGTTFIDRFWDRAFDQANQIFQALKKRIAIALVKYHQASVSPAPVSAPTDPVLEPLPDAHPVERIPVSVKNIGTVRRVQFSLDMPLDTQVDVRIGATREAGVTVEKREL